MTRLLELGIPFSLAENGSIVRADATKQDCAYRSRAPIAESED
jgi:hypothetical protein